MCEKSLHLNDETKIVWIEDPTQFPYLREKVQRLPFRSRFPISEWRGKFTKLVGYSEISLWRTESTMAFTVAFGS